MYYYPAQLTIHDSSTAKKKMLGLVSYDSDEEEETQQQKQENEEGLQPTKTAIAHDPSKKAGQVAFQVNISVQWM